jgi:hypothetical protein
MEALYTVESSSRLLATTSGIDLLKLLSPALTHSLYLATNFQRLLGTTALFVMFRAYYLSTILLRQSFYATQLLLLQSYYASALLSKHVFSTTKQTLKAGWKVAKPLREKLFFEFMVFVLGGGNGMLLVIFWPGWIVVGCVAWGIWGH